MKRLFLHLLLPGLFVAALSSAALADKLNPLVSLNVTRGTLEQISQQIAKQTGNRVVVPAELQKVSGVTLVVHQVSLSSALEMLRGYNICAWRQVTQASNDRLFVEFGYCNAPPFPREMAHWFEPW